MQDKLLLKIAHQISQTNGEEFKVQQQQSVGGGCINTAFVLSDGKQSFFVKMNSASLLSMFEAEFDGLQEIAASKSIRVPNPLCFGRSEGQAYLVMQYLNIANSGVSLASIEQLGQDLAKMHQSTATQFGWHRDNTIGSTPQVNDYQSSWLEFWSHQRLAYQLQLAAQNGFSGRLQSKGEQLLADLGVFFQSYTPQASLLHGDLWSGNYSVDAAGVPVVYDPAVYYGDRETDLAMTELFGGFPARFYHAYNEVTPLDEGYSTRKTLYNLYHILNHVNLFGGSYLAQAETMISQLLSERLG